VIVPSGAPSCQLGGGCDNSIVALVDTEGWIAAPVGPAPWSRRRLEEGEDGIDRSGTPLDYPDRFPPPQPETSWTTWLCGRGEVPRAQSCESLWL